MIGSGPCGLGAGWRLEELSRLGLSDSGDWALVDSAQSAGGLAGSVVDAQGFSENDTPLAAAHMDAEVERSEEKVEGNRQREV